jgi:prepilin-type N-terminal cleavage/methylation domain-containing protein
VDELMAIRPRHRSRTAASGMTLLEVMVALAILATGMVAMLMLQITAMRGGRHGRNVDEAARVAQQQMEYLDGQPFSALAATAWTAPVNVTAQTTGGVGLGQTFAVSYRIVADPLDTSILHLDVQVSWLEPSDVQGQPPHLYAISTDKHDDPCNSPPPICPSS